jgi:dTDP-4-dehydrorhamnose reductase
MNERVLILGVGGMLGHTCFEYFKGLDEFQVHATWRKAPQEGIISFDALGGPIEKLIKEIDPDWIINCIGLIKQKINETDQISVANTVKINQDFPQKIANAVGETMRSRGCLCSRRCVGEV